MRTQILITDIPKDKFSSQWPAGLEKELFEVKYPELKAKLQYFTPLSFLNRIIIILDDEPSAITVYKYLLSRQESWPVIKLFLTETLLRSRSKSFDATTGSTNTDGKPILSLDTDPSTTGVATSSLDLISTSLSPDRTSLESPTLLKFSGDQKLHYYQEPLPRTSSLQNLSPTSTSSTTTIENNRSSTLETPKRPLLSVKTAPVATTGLAASPASPAPPRSPTIRINGVFDQ